MAQFMTKTEKRTELNNVINDIQCGNENDKWADNSVKGIIKAIQWPKPLVAMRNAVYTISASVLIGGVLYLYGYLINQAIAMVR